MKWSKRLKWIRISKIVIPIALAISILFAGFSVFANEAKNFVVDIYDNENTKLSLTYNRDLTNLTDHLDIPVLGSYRDVTWKPSESVGKEYSQLDDYDLKMPTLPDDIALQDGVHTVFADEGVVSFFSFSFYLVNSSNREVEVEFAINIDEIATTNNEENIHIDDAVRLMLIEGEYLLSSAECKANSVIYKKADRITNDDALNDGYTSAGVVTKPEYEDLGYTVEEFASTSRVMKNDSIHFPCKLAPASVTDRSNVKRYTVIIWLEGNDYECTNAIFNEAMKMSMTFKGLDD